MRRTQPEDPLRVAMNRAKAAELREKKLEAIREQVFRVIW
jgi:hypothetical protein